MFSKKKNVEVFSGGEGSCDGLSEQSCWSSRNEVKTGGCTYPFSFCWYILLSCHFLCSNASYCWVFFSVANFLLSLTMYHLITFQPFLKKTFLSYAINSTSICKRKKRTKKTQHFFAAVLFFFAKRTMVLYNLNMVHLICKAYTKYLGGKDKKIRYMLSLLMMLRYICLFILISSCVLYLLSIYLFWAELEVDLWHWSTLFIKTTHVHTCTHALFRTEPMQIRSVLFSPSWWIVIA